MKQDLIIPTCPYYVIYDKVKKYIYWGKSYHKIKIFNRKENNKLICEFKIPGYVELDSVSFVKEFTEVTHRIYNQGFTDASIFLKDKENE